MYVWHAASGDRAGWSSEAKWDSSVGPFHPVRTRRSKPTLSTLNKMDPNTIQTVQTTPAGRAPRVTSIVSGVFADAWDQGIRNPAPELIVLWQHRFNLNQDQITGWFKRKRAKERKATSNSALSPTAHPQITEFARLEEEALKAEEQAGCQELPELGPETVVRLVTIFNKMNPTANQLEGISDIMGINLSDIERFSQWRATRRLRLAGGTLQTQLPQILAFPTLNLAAQMPTTPSTSGNNTQSPFTPQEIPSHMEVDSEVEEAVASLPTPQPSVGRSPSPPKAQPEPHVPTLWDFWKQEEEMASVPSKQTNSIPTQQLLQALLPSLPIAF